MKKSKKKKKQKCHILKLKVRCNISNCISYKIKLIKLS